MPINTQHLKQWKQQGRPIVALTAWDYAIAQLLDGAGVDLILVGDSLSVILGYETTLPVTLEEIIHHAKAVKRGIKRALLVVDLPFLTYQESIGQAMQSAGRVMKETGAQGVKLEGGYPAMIDIISRLVQAGIPVLGHLGLTPQSIHQIGSQATRQNPPDRRPDFSPGDRPGTGGCICPSLEHIPSHLAVKITKELSIPTIGIGAGQGCDGQILVTSDVLGLSEKQPPFAKVYTDLRQEITKAVEKYALEVRNHHF